MAEKKKEEEKRINPKIRMEETIESLKLTFDALRKKRDAAKGTKAWHELHIVMERVKLSREELRLGLAAYNE